jgi:hypothetical protein
VSNPVPALLAGWRQLRAELRALEEAEHPPVIDRFGRVWAWVDGDLYEHDGLLAWPLDAVLDPNSGLPRPGLAQENPNYADLCAVCRRVTALPGVQLRP